MQALLLKLCGELISLSMNRFMYSNNHLHKMHSEYHSVLYVPSSELGLHHKEFIIKMEGNTAEFSDISGSEIH
jgi:hypothetical protein